MTYTPAKQELHFLEMAIVRNENRLNVISDDFHRECGVCCVSCWSEEYRTIARKVERQRNRRDELKMKIISHEPSWESESAINELITHYRRKTMLLSRLENLTRSSGWTHYAAAGRLTTRRFSLIARLQEILRRIAPTHPLAHLDINGDPEIRVPVFVPKPLPELPKFGEDP